MLGSCPSFHLLFPLLQPGRNSQRRQPGLGTLGLPLNSSMGLPRGRGARRPAWTCFSAPAVWPWVRRSTSGSVKTSQPPATSERVHGAPATLCGPWATSGRHPGPLGVGGHKPGQQRAKHNDKGEGKAVVTEAWGRRGGAGKPVLKGQGHP